MDAKKYRISRLQFTYLTYMQVVQKHLIHTAVFQLSSGSLECMLRHKISQVLFILKHVGVYILLVTNMTFWKFPSCITRDYKYRKIKCIHIDVHILYNRVLCSNKKLVMALVNEKYVINSLFFKSWLGILFRVTILACILSAFLYNLSTRVYVYCNLYSMSIHCLK